MNDGHELRGLRDYLNLVRRHRRLVAGVIAATIVAAVVGSMFTSFTHRSSVELLVQAPTEHGVSRTVFGDDDLRTQQRLITSLDVAERAAAGLGIPTDPTAIRRLLDDVTVEQVADTSIMVISAEHEEPEMAAAIPLAFAESYTDFREELAQERIGSVRQQLKNRIEQLDAQLDEVAPGLGAGDAAAADDDAFRRLSERDQLLARLAAVEEQLTELAFIEEFATSGRVISPVAVPQQESLWMVLLRNVALGLVLGATLGIMLAFAREWADDRIVNERDITALTSRALLGRVQPSGLDGSRSSHQLDPASSDVYRALKATAWVGLAAAGPKGDPSGTVADTRLPFPVLLVTDIDGRSSGSEVAANLARAFARSGTRTLLVDARRHRGASTYVIEAPTGAGLNEVIAGESPIETASRSTREGGLRVVTPGREDPRAGDALTARRFAEVVRPLDGDADLVVIDAGPASSAGEALELAIVATTTILVAAWERSTRQSLRDAVHRLRGAGADILGTVAVEWTSSRASSAADEPATSVAQSDDLPPRSDAQDRDHRTDVLPG